MRPEEREELTRIADEQRARGESEYAQYVAAQDIKYNGVLAYPAGAPVPASNVRLHGYLTHGLVITAEEAAAQREAAETPPDDTEIQPDQIDGEDAEADASSSDETPPGKPRK